MQSDQTQTSNDSQEQSSTSPGWVKLHRQIRNHWVYQNPVFLQIWIEFLLLANFDRAESLINGKFIVLKKGQFLFGRRKFAQRLGCSEWQLRAFITAASSAGMIATRKFSKYSIISITNYDLYQENRQHTARFSASTPPANRQHAATSKDVKKKKSANGRFAAQERDFGI